MAREYRRTCDVCGAPPDSWSTPKRSEGGFPLPLCARCRALYDQLLDGMETRRQGTHQLPESAQEAWSALLALRQRRGLKTLTT